MPDALSKTIPIWIAVLNRLLIPNDLDAGQLTIPGDVVSRSEHARIEERIPAFVAEAEWLRLDKDSLRVKLHGKPLRPIWITPDTNLSKLMPEFSDWNLNPMVLCTASGRTSSERSIANYVQGAADDSESWAFGLDALTFWRHSEHLRSTSEDELPGVIDSLMSESRSHLVPQKPVLVKPTSNLWISNNDGAVPHCKDFDLVVSCSEKPSEDLGQRMGAKYLHLSCATGKIGSRQLRSELPKLEQLFSKVSSSTRILVTCHTSRDLAIGVGLAVLCRCYSEDGVLQPLGRSVSLSKATIKHRLSWIMVSMPDASPSRATLQSVNAFLLG